MALTAMAIPILPGKTEQWKRFADELTGARQREYQASRRGMGVHERTFLEPTPNGDLVVVTLEGEDPVGSFRKFASGQDEFTQWFLQQSKEIHGLDLALMSQFEPPALVIDSEAPVPTRAG